MRKFTVTVQTVIESVFEVEAEDIIAAGIDAQGLARDSAVPRAETSVDGPTIVSITEA